MPSALKWDGLSAIPKPNKTVISKIIEYLYPEEITESRAESTGLTARGHIMEPWVVQEYNRIFRGSSQIYHWDDCVVYGRGISYSPDALNIPQPPDMIEISTKDINPTEIVEIKSYAKVHHIECVHADKNDLKERYQLVVGMLVNSTIKKGSLVFFNPNCGAHSFHIKHWYRSELEDEIDAVKKTIRYFNRAVEWFIDSLNDSASYVTALSESLIREEARKAGRFKL